MEEISRGTGERDRLKNTKLSTWEETNVQPCGMRNERRRVVVHETPLCAFRAQTPRTRENTVTLRTHAHTFPRNNSISRRNFYILEKSFNVSKMQNRKVQIAVMETSIKWNSGTEIKAPLRNLYKNLRRRYRVSFQFNFTRLFILIFFSIITIVNKNLWLIGLQLLFFVYKWYEVHRHPKTILQDDVV